MTNSTSTDSQHECPTWCQHHDDIGEGKRCHHSAHTRGTGIKISATVITTTEKMFGTLLYIGADKDAPLTAEETLAAADLIRSVVHEIVGAA
jgi:hypothetical protein